MRLLYIVSFYFSILVFGDEAIEIQIYCMIVFLFSIVFHFCLARLAHLALQTEIIVQKITQPIFLFSYLRWPKRKTKSGMKRTFTSKLFQ